MPTTVKVRRSPTRLRPFPQGLTMAYIGAGKGKTTAAVGVATRALGYGWKVLFFQFFKSPQWPSGERNALRKLGADVQVYGEGFVGILGDNKPLAQHQQAAKQALARAWKLIASGKYQLMVMDEVISCLEQKLFSVSTLGAFLKARANHPKAKRVHLVLTGHEKYPAILKYCDLVSEMKMVKHPYYQGFIAVKGIDY
jgi:cob(I)alamin adenosyltransferase